MHLHYHLLKDYLKLDDKALLEAFPNATEEEIKSGKTRERLTKMGERLDKIDKAYKKLNDEIINPFDPDLYKEGTQEYLNEKINHAAFNHSKMLALFANDSFERSLERINNMYQDIANVSGSFATNDVDNLLDTKKLIGEIDLLKTEIELSTKPNIVLNAEGEAVEEPKVLTDDEKIQLEKKKEKLVLLQNIFGILTTPAFITRGDFAGVTVEEDDDEKTVKQKESEQKVLEKTLEVMRDRILSDESLKTNPDLVRKLAESVADPFGQFKEEHLEDLVAVIEPYLEFLLRNSDVQDTSLLPKDINEVVQKIIDYKIVKGRSEDLDFAVRTILAPENLANLSEKIAPRFKKLYWENKANVEKRIREYVGIVERNQFLSTLAKAGIFPRQEEVAKFLKDGTIPVTYGNYNGVLDESSGRSWTILQDAITTYENIRGNKDKPKQQKTKDTTEEDTTKNSEFNYEDNFEDPVDDVDPEMDDQDLVDTVDVEPEKVIDKQIAKNYLKDQWKIYVKNQTAKDKSYLDYTVWLKSNSSNTQRKRAIAINEIVQNIYTPTLISGKTSKGFYEWLSENRNDKKVRDILRLYNLTIGQISPGSVPKTFDTSIETKGKRKTTPHSSGLNIQKREITTKGGDKVNQYVIVDNNNDAVSDDVYDTSREATLARDSIAKTNTEQEQYTIGKQELSKGEIVQDEKGNWWIIQSTKTEVEKGGKVKLHKYNIKNPRKKDKKIIKIATFQKGYTVVKNDEINFINTVAKLPVKEPLTVFPHKDYTIKNKGEREEKALEGQQEVLRKLRPSQIGNIKVEIVKNEIAGDIDIRNRRNFRFGDKESNPKIKMGQQKYSIKFIINTKEGDKTIGYLQGPETALFLNQSGEKGKQISVFDINESNVRDYFIIYPNQNVEDIVKQIHENYTAAYYIYKQLDTIFKNTEISKYEKYLSELQK